MPKAPLRFGRYDIAAFAAFTAYAVCSFSIPLTLVGIGNSLGFPLDRGGMGAGGVLHFARSLAMIASLLCCGLVAARFGKRFTMGGSMWMGVPQMPDNVQASSKNIFSVSSLPSQKNTCGDIFQKIIVEWT